MTKLHLAAANGDYEEVRRLVEEGADVNIGCEVNQTAMMAAAAFYGHFDIVKYLHLHQGQTSASPTMLVILP